MQYSSKILFLFITSLLLTYVFSLNINTIKKNQGTNSTQLFKSFLRDNSLVKIEITQAKAKVLKNGAEAVKGAKGVLVSKSKNRNFIWDDDDDDSDEPAIDPEDDDIDLEKYLHKHRNCLVSLLKYDKDETNRHGRVKDHFYTTDEWEIGKWKVPKHVGKKGFGKYKFEGIMGRCLNHHHNPWWYWERKTHTHCGAIPLYRYYNQRYKDHFYTTNEWEIDCIVPGREGKYGYRYEGIACFVFPTNGNERGLVPIHRYYNRENVDHAYTLNPNEFGTTVLGQTKNGYTYEGIQGYMWPPAA